VRIDPSPALAGVAILLQIAYPLVTGAQARSTLTVVTVGVFFMASITHALVHRGARFTGLYLLITLGVGLVAEAVGTATGVPFGDYDYSDTLGGKLLGVPWVIPLAWAMFAYPCLLVGQRLARTGPGSVAVAAIAMASWDLFLDPQMVQAGHWRFTDVQAWLPGAPGIPLSNYLGWLAVSLVIMSALHTLGRCDTDERVPATLFLWTYTSSVLANAVFFDRPLTALVGGIGMGVVAVPYGLSLWRSRVLASA